MAKQNKNPTHNSIYQALLDLQKLGYGSRTVDDLIAHLDRKELAKLQAVWDGHAYPDKTLRFSQQVINQGVFQLSASALSVLTLLGMYADKGGCIQIKQEDIAALFDYSDRYVRTLLKELIEAKAIRVAIPSVRHAAPVYEVNSLLYTKGGAVLGEWQPPVQPKLIIKTEHIYTQIHGEAEEEAPQRYTRVSLVKAKEPRDMDDLDALFNANI